MKKNEYITLFIGVLFGILLSWCAVVVKDDISFRLNCDGVTVSKTFGDRYCIDPAILEESK